MITFRYHVMSIFAVFLALGIGILVGTTVLDAATVRALEVQVGTLRNSLDNARGDIERLRSDRDRNEVLVDQLTPWTITGRLDGRQVVIVSDSDTDGWTNDVRASILQAGAEHAGTMRLTDWWASQDPERDETLRELAAATMGPIEADASLPDDLLAELGRRVFEPDGQRLLQALVEERAVVISDTDAQAAWPQAGALFVVFATPYPDEEPQPEWLAAFALGISEVAGTLVVAEEPGLHDSVAVIRESVRPPLRLSTFDTGSASFGGLAAVLALEVAATGNGDHFGTEGGRRVLPDQP